MIEFIVKDEPINYLEGLALQKKLHQQTIEANDPQSGFILMVEHLPTLTFGKNADPAHLLFSPEILKEKGIELVHTDRGGQITAHNPGQLVVYPILNLRLLKIGVKKYVTLLEDVVLQTLLEFGIHGERSDKNPGIWVNGKKIASIGIRIAQGISYHGFALNVSNDLEIFRLINSCGLSDVQPTNIKNFSENCPTIIAVHQVLKRYIGVKTT